MILEVIVSISIGLWVWGVISSIEWLKERVDELEERVDELEELIETDDEVEE